MAAAAFFVAVVHVAPVLPAPAPATPVATPVAMPVAPVVPAVGSSLRNAMMQNEKLWFTYNLPVYLVNTARQYQRHKSETKIS